jgi:hypothetical protein
MSPVFLSLAFCWGLVPGSSPETANCETVSGPHPYVSEASCAVDAQQLAAAWLRRRDPRWRLIGWTCGPGAEDDV